MELYEKNGNILYVLNILKKYSNEDHILSSNKIRDLIKEEYNVLIDSRTVRRNINLLIEKFNYDIEKYEENNKGYFIRRDPESEFENGELSAILNTFAYSNFIPEKMSYSIIDKCLNMMDIYEKDKYKNYKASIKNTRTDNLEIIKNIEDVNEAIFNKKKITFDYYKYELNERLEYVFEGKTKTTPYKLVYALQKFYLICLDEEKKELFSRRLDRMKNISITNEKISNKFDENEIDFFIKSNVSMLSGDTEKVEIECDMSLLDNVIELYGKDIKVSKIDDNKFYASFYTTIKGFRYWCLRNIETVKVLSPQSLIKDIKKVMKDNI
ncbi:MAG: WYL domain-containing protein [Erysipelotrichales bacterium]|nr:WYL domain-containing protein [Erysipelotrichales bacterium]